MSWGLEIKKSQRRRPKTLVFDFHRLCCLPRLPAPLHTHRNPMFVFVLEASLFKLRANGPAIDPLFQLPPRSAAPPEGGESTLYLFIHFLLKLSTLQKTEPFGPSTKVLPHLIQLALISLQTFSHFFSMAYDLLHLKQNLKKEWGHGQ